MDPTLLAVLSIFGGVAVTAGAGLLGAWIQSNREHARWIRERRLDAYIRFLGVVQAFEAERLEVADIGAEINAIVEQNDKTHEHYQNSTDPEERASLKAAGDAYNSRLDALINLNNRASDRVGKLRESLADNSVPFGLLGPGAVQAIAFAVSQSDGDATFGENISLLHQAMRKALDIKD